MKGKRIGCRSRRRRRRIPGNPILTQAKPETAARVSQALLHCRHRLRPPLEHRRRMRLLASTLLLARTRADGGRHHGRALLSVRIRACAQLAQLNETAATAMGVISVVVGVIGVVVGGCGCDRGALTGSLGGKIDSRHHRKGQLCPRHHPCGGFAVHLGTAHHAPIPRPIRAFVPTALVADRRRLPPAWGVRAGERG